MQRTPAAWRNDDYASSSSYESDDSQNEYEYQQEQTMEGGASASSMSPSSRPPRPTSAASWLWHWPGDDDVDGGADDVDTALVCAQLEDAFEGKTKGTQVCHYRALTHMWHHSTRRAARGG